MVDALKSLVIDQIREVFPDVEKVYDEPVQQGLSTPAFLVLIYHDKLERQLRHRMKREIEINVTYFPADKRRSNSELDVVAEKFKYNFRRLADRYHINKLEAVKHDGTLVVTFNVKTILEELIDETLMQTLKFGGVKND